MEYEYTAGSTLPKDRLRLLIPDKPVAGITPPALFSDEELNELVTMFGDVWMAAAEACEIIASNAAKTALFFTLNTGISVDKRKIPEVMQKRADSLRRYSVAGTPIERIDSFSYRIDSVGRDRSDYDNLAIEDHNDW